MHLDKLAGARLTGTMQAAYSLLCRIVRTIGWEATLLVRSGAFWMQDDYRSFAASIDVDAEPATVTVTATSATTGSTRVLSPLAHQVTTTIITAPSPSSSSASSLSSTHEVAAAAAAPPTDEPHGPGAVLDSESPADVPAAKTETAASLSSVALGTVGTPTLQSPPARPRLLSSMSEDRESRRGQLQRHDSGVTVRA